MTPAPFDPRKTIMDGPIAHPRKVEQQIRPGKKRHRYHEYGQKCLKQRPYAGHFCQSSLKINKYAEGGPTDGKSDEERVLTQVFPAHSQPPYP